MNALTKQFEGLDLRNAMAFSTARALSSQLPTTLFGRSRPAAGATREVEERWLLDGLEVSVGHRRCSCDPSSKNDAGRTPAT